MERRLFAIGLLATFGACAPAAPRIDGAPAAPPSPSALWPVPQAAREPPPPATTPVAPEATAALRGDTSSYEDHRLEVDDVVDLALRTNPTTRASWLDARAAADAYGSSRGLLMPGIEASITTGRTSSAPVSIASLGTGSGNEINTRNAATGSRCGASSRGSRASRRIRRSRPRFRSVDGHRRASISSPCRAPT